MRTATTAAVALLLAAAGAPLAAEPAFAPGLYETQTRGAAELGRKHRVCISAPTLAAFRRETIAAFLREPQFRAVCRLSAPRDLADGFALAMECGRARSITTYRFAPGVFGASTRTLSTDRSDQPSVVETLWHRLGDCKTPLPPPPP